MKVPELVAVPPGVVIAILPVFAPIGTVAVTFESLKFTEITALVPFSTATPVYDNNGYQWLVSTDNLLAFVGDVLDLYCKSVPDSHVAASGWQVCPLDGAGA